MLHVHRCKSSVVIVTAFGWDASSKQTWFLEPMFSLYIVEYVVQYIV